MDLAFRDLGGRGPTTVFLHGLFGSSQNWAGMGRRLTGVGRCVLLDLRNHGDSPHAPTHSLADCVGDVADWARLHAPGPLRLIGHSMGGLVAMAFAIAHPEVTAGVVSIDIAPRSYSSDNSAELKAFHSDISRCRTRGELDMLLAPVIPDPGVRQFILTNAVRDGEGFKWRLNLPALESSTLNRDFPSLQASYSGPALLVAGGRSSYVTEADRAVMLRYFPAAEVLTIAKADHWIHVSAPDELLAILIRFLGPTPQDGAIKGRVLRP